MKPFTSETGRVAILDRPDVDTDQIIPKQFLKRIERTGYGEFLFYDWRYDENGAERPGFELNRPEFAGASILLAGRNFGCGSSREHAAWALQDYGSRWSSRPRSATSSGRTPARSGWSRSRFPKTRSKRLMEGVDLDRGSEMTVDLERRMIVAPDGREIAFAFDEATRQRLLHGLDEIALTLQHEDEIAAYETRTASRDARRRPPRRRDRARGRRRGDPRARRARDRALRAPLRRQRDPRPGDAAARRDARGLPGEPTRCCSAPSGCPSSRASRSVRSRGCSPSGRSSASTRTSGPRVAEGIDLIVVRELVGGLYFGEKGTRDDGTWFDTCEYSRPEVERIARRAFEIARARDGRLTSVDKVNVMHTSRLWRDVVTELGRDRVPGHRARPRARRLVRDDDRERARDDRRRRHREHLRGHPLGHRGGGDGRPRSRRLRLPRRLRPGALRARARLGAADRRAGNREPGRDAPLHRADAPPRPRPAGRRRDARAGDRRRARDGADRSTSAAPRRRASSATRSCGRSMRDLRFETMESRRTDRFFGLFFAFRG